MAKSKESRSVGYSTSITIGGKKYNSFEISSQKDTRMKEVRTVTGTEHAPRMVGKELRNEAGIRQTDMNLHQAGSYDYYNQRRVQTEAARTSSSSVSSSYERTQPESRYQSQPEYSSSYSSYSQPESNYNYEQRRIHTDNIQTASQMESSSYERAQSLSQSQSQYKAEDLVYRSSNAESRSNMTEALGYSVNSQATRVQTMESGSGYSYNNRAEQSQPEHSSYYSSYSQSLGNYNHEQKRIHTDNIQTASQIESSSYERAQSLSQSQSQYKTEDLVYRSSNAESRSNMTEALGYSVNSQATRVQTMESGTGYSYNRSEPEHASSYSGFGQSLGNYNHEQKRIHTDNIQTASQIESSSYQRVQEQNQSQSQYSAENLIYRSSDVESKSNMTEALGYNVSSQASRIHTLEKGNSFQAERGSEQGMYTTSYNAPAGYYNREQTRIHTDKIQTASQQEALSYERVQERNLANAQYDTENLIYQSSNVESRGTMAESLGSVRRLQKPGVMTEDDKGVTKAEFNSKRFRIHGEHLETLSKRNNASVDRVTEQSKSLQSNNVMTSEAMQSMMMQGVQMVGGLKMLDAIDQNRAKDEDESFADSMMPIIKTAIKAGIVVNAVGTISNYTTGSDRSLLHPEEDEKASGAVLGAAIGGGATGLFSAKPTSWYEGKKKGDYIRSFSKKKGASPRSWGLSDNALVSEKSGLFGMLGGSEEEGLVGNLSSDNLMVNKWTINTGIQNNVTTGRTIQTAVGAGVEGITGMWNPMAGMWKNSLLKQWNTLKKKIVSFFTDPAESLTSSLSDSFTMVGMGALIPILIIVVAFSSSASVINVPLLATSSFFGGVFDRDNENDTTTEIDIRDFLENDEKGVPFLRDKYINDLLNDITNLKRTFPFGPGYHIVRLRFNDNTYCTGQTYEEISAAFYSQDELVTMIQPIFNAYLMMEYNLQPTQRQAREALADIFSVLIDRDDEDGVTEHCGQSIATGEGTANSPASACNQIHALSDCPNIKSTTHSSYTYSCCDTKKCDGHEVDCDDDCPEDCPGHADTYCGGCEFDSCSTHKVCDGHKVKNIKLSLDGIYMLIYEYFTHPIEQLEGNAHRTEEEEIKLQTLKDYYELFEELMQHVYSTYAYGSLTKAELLAIDMDGDPSEYGDAIIQIALSQVGYAGGERYWKWFDPSWTQRVEWCACFVSWCMDKVGHSEVRYASCAGVGVPYFQGLGGSRWKDGTYTTPVAGDVIFFDWDGGGSDHTGLVVGTYNGEVYTIEGNSGDAVKIKKYTLGSSVIYGYGIMN